jgi:putative radical SAM enzyme (TIGR03279 family)
MMKQTNKPQGHEIKAVKSGSPAHTAGIKPGWKLLRIDNQPVSDILDYRIMTADEQVTMLLLTENGHLRRVRLKLSGAASPGLEFISPAIAPLQQCGNRCIFCFIEQNPPGMRSSLYLKDDDYRLSFLYGNFITLNRVTDAELKRIISLQLSPLYVSVHTTNPELRQKMFGTKRAAKGLLNLKRLVKAGIKVHAQIVLCPGYNTGEELIRTLADLDQLGENVLTVALVPVGLTCYREGLTELNKFTAAEVAELVKAVEQLQLSNLKKRGTRFVFLADEFYSMAGITFPPEEAYEGFPQLENGVGLARLFLSELDCLQNAMPEKLSHQLTATLVTGKSAEPLIRQLAEKLSQIEGLTINVQVATNKYFGDRVTVSGLLTGSDLLAAFEGKEAGDVVFITESQLKDQSELFLDNMSLSELEASLKTTVRAVSGPLQLLESLVTINENHMLENKGR